MEDGIENLDAVKEDDDTPPNSPPMPAADTRPPEEKAPLAKKAAAKKSAAKKAAAKKSAAKKSAAKKSAAKPRAKKPVVNSATEVAEHIIAGGNNGRWGSGRERDEALKRAGYDPNEVRREITRLRSKKLTENS